MARECLVVCGQSLAKLGRRLSLCHGSSGMDSRGCAFDWVGRRSFRIAPQCSTRALPCFDFLCDICIHRLFGDAADIEVDEDQHAQDLLDQDEENRKENAFVSLSPTQPFNPYSAAAPQIVCEAAGLSMAAKKQVIDVEPDVAQEGCRPAALNVPDEFEEDEHMAAAPTTPGTKRHMEEQTTPTKVPRGAPTADEVQQQILTVVLSLQATTQDTKTLLNRLTDRVMAQDRTRGYRTEVARHADGQRERIHEHHHAHGPVAGHDCE